MGTIYQRVYLYKQKPSEDLIWDETSPIDLTLKATGVDIKKGIGSIKDTFSFKLNRAKDFFDGTLPYTIGYGDLIRIWMKRDSYAFIDHDMMIEGVIQSTPMKMGTSGNILTIKGNDFFEMLFEVQVPVSGVEHQQKTWNEILRSLMDRYEFSDRNLLWDYKNDLAVLNPPNGYLKGTNTTATANKLINSTATFSTNGVVANMTVINVDTGVETDISSVDSEIQLTLADDIFPSTGGNYIIIGGVSTKSDGTSFPKLDIALNYTPFYEITERLTSNENTKDGQYYYFVRSAVNGKRYLTIRNMQEVDAIATFSQGVTTEGISVDKGKDEVKNFVVYNCGTDLAGNAIEDVYYDLGSIGKVGFKYFYMVEESADISGNIMSTEAKADGGINFNWDATEEKWTSSDHYPTGYNYTWVSFKDESGSTITSTDADDFNSDLSEIALLAGKQAARRYVDNTKNPPYTETLNFPFRNNFILGGLYNVNLPGRNVNRPLRIKEASYSIKNGTDITFEEDPHRSTL